MVGRVLGVMAAGALLVAAPAGAAELQAAYDYYEPGQGFQIGLVNAATGAAITLPAGVNSTDDELHPTLSPDGKTLAFTRMKLLPKLNGDIVPPPQRTLVSVNLQTGAVSVFGAGGVGPTFTQREPGNVQLSWALQPDGTTSREGNSLAGATGDVPNLQPSPMYTQLLEPNVFFTHAAGVTSAFFEPIAGRQRARDLRLWSHAVIDPVTGAAPLPKVRLQLHGVGESNPDLLFRLKQLDLNNSTHPVPRVSDDLVALAQLGDITTITFPAQGSADAAPAPITTSAVERMPAWAPDGQSLAFVREADGRRQLNVYDLTPGIQAIINPAVDLGTLAPTPQTRAFQDLWGGLSVSAIPEAPAVVVIGGGKVRINSLTPTITKKVPSLKIGIFVVRRTGGTKTVLGVKQPKIKVVGRVPLGAVKKNGRNTFKWDGRVNGKRLQKGQYLVTFRLLKGDAVTSLSDSIPFTVR